MCYKYYSLIIFLFPLSSLKTLTHSISLSSSNSQPLFSSLIVITCFPKYDLLDLYNVIRAFKCDHLVLDNQFVFSFCSQHFLVTYSYLCKVEAAQAFSNLLCQVYWCHSCSVHISDTLQVFLRNRNFLILQSFQLLFHNVA